jgi:nitrite reductase/ring-hydroxylating ferredoxin subunit
MPSLQIVLGAREREAAERGRFVRVDLGVVRDFNDVRARTALVGRVDGAWRAYANACRHHAIPLDIAVDSPMADDGVHLLCHQHGARYRPNDGYCVGGPCTGASLVAIAIEENEGALTLSLP